MFCGASSRAKHWAMPRNANLPIAKAVEPAMPLTLAVAPVSRIVPWPWTCMRFAAAWATRKPPKAVTRIASSSRAGSIASMVSR